MNMRYRVEWLNGLGVWETDTTFSSLDEAIRYAKKEYKRLIRYSESTLHHRVIPESYGAVYTTEGDKTL